MKIVRADDVTQESQTGDAPTIYYSLKDDVVLTGADIEDPRAEKDKTSGDPTVTFEFTEGGRRAFQEARRSLRSAGS